MYTEGIVYISQRQVRRQLLDTSAAPFKKHLIFHLSGKIQCALSILILRLCQGNNIKKKVRKIQFPF